MLCKLIIYWSYYICISISNWSYILSPPQKKKKLIIHNKWRSLWLLSFDNPGLWLRYFNQLISSPSLRLKLLKTSSISGNICYDAHLFVRNQQCMPTISKLISFANNSGKWVSCNYIINVATFGSNGHNCV